MAEDFFEKQIRKQDFLEEVSQYNVTFHNHTDASLNDAITTPEELVARAKEIGAPSIGITDHGGCQNWINFYNAARKEGIKPVLGVEAYIKNDHGSYNHLILLAKNYKGFQELSQFATETEMHREKMRIKEIPVGTEDMLDMVSNGNVICTSACIQGPVADPYMDWYDRDRQIEHIQKMIDKLNLPDRYDEAVNIYNDCSHKIDELDERIKTADKDTAKQLRTEKKAIQDYLRQKSHDGGPSIKETISKGNQKKKRYEELKGQIAEINNGRKTMERARAEAVEIARRYQARFGSDFFMEVQYHGIDMEKTIYPALAGIADELGIPLIAANDAHVPTKDKTWIRNMIQNLAFPDGSWKDMSASDEELYIKTGTELARSLLQILPQDKVLEAMRNTETIDHEIEDFDIPKGKNYPVVENAEQELRQRTLEGAMKRFPNGLPSQEYNERMREELKTIDDMQFPSYFLTILDIVDHFKEIGKENGDMLVGLGRGSGGGSETNYLTGITELDPLEYSLIFERFLNKERVTMPDIDTDFSPKIRPDVIQYCKDKYGEDMVAGIMTTSKYGLKSGIDAGTRAYGKKAGDKRKFSSLASKIKKTLDENGIDDPTEALDYFRAQNADKDTLNILICAQALYGRTSNYGQHASGEIIGPVGHKLSEFIPLMAVTDKEGRPGLAIQADMVQAEAQLGFIKFDFLGLTNLDIISRTMHMIKDGYGIELDPYNLPFEEKTIKDIYEKGDTNFIFQFESEGMKKMLAEMKPSSIGDLILAVSVYRPGPMDFIPSIIDSKNNGTPSQIVSRVPMLEDVLKETYGYPVYQEQVMRIMTVCAGFSLGEADNVRRAMSKKHIEDLKAVEPKFIEGCRKNGIQPEDSKWLFDQLMPFAQYGFNKSHAAAYAITSYITGYLKEHYFREYICGAIAEQGEKIPQLIEDCRRHDVEIKIPDVNESLEDFRPYGDNAILYGLSGIKGVKGAAKDIVEERNKNGKYKDLADFIWRVNPDKGVMEALAGTGAFASFIKDRKQALRLAEEYKENRTNILSKKKVFEKAHEKYIDAVNSGAPQKTVDKLKKAEERVKDDYEYAKASWTDVRSASRLKSKKKDDLDKEMKYLGGWISGSPLEDYSVKGYDKADCETGNRTVAGIVSNFKPLRTKKDKLEMGKFTIIDENGNKLNCIAFPDSYARIKTQIQDGAAIAVKGYVELTDKFGSSDPDEKEKQMKVSYTEALKEKQDVIHMTAKDIPEVKNVMEQMTDHWQKMMNPDGIPCIVTIEQTGETKTFKPRFDKEAVDWMTSHGVRAEMEKVEPDEYGLKDNNERQQESETTEREPENTTEYYDAADNIA